MPRQFSSYDYPTKLGVELDIPVDLGDLNDSNGNEMLELDAVASAVNYFRFANSATGDPVILSARGDDTNVGFDIDPLGTGAFRVLSGADTGNAVDIVSTALTTGKSIDLSDLDAITTGKAIHIDATGITHTSGILVHLDSAGTVITGDGRLFLSDHTGATTTSGTLNEFKTAATDETIVVAITTAAMIDGVALSITGTTGMTTGSLIKASSSTAGALATNGVISLTATGAFTSTSATNGGFVEVKANSTTAGTVVNVVSSGLTTGIALQLSNGTSAITTGSMVRVTTSGTGIIATNGIVSVRHAGIFTSTSNVGVLDVVASALVGAGTVVRFAATAASQTAAEILNITQSGATLTAYTGSIASVTAGFSGSSSTGSAVLITAVNDTAGDALKIVSNAVTLGAATLINLSHTTSILGAGSSMLRITSTGVDTGTTTGTMLDISATAAQAAHLAIITGAGLTSGIGLKFTLAALTTGSAIDTTGIAATKQNFNMNSTTGSTAAPQTNAPTGFFKIGIGGTDQWVPYYNSS